uniref:Uncharacterized protein n=1 Tax=viral metagenome TaxID=1070528 RepID=A0A6M3IR32_9ZZZZ
MTEPKKEELDSLPESSEGENQDGAGEGDPSNKPTAEEEKAELEEKLLKEQKARGDFETAFYKEREKNRLLSEKPLKVEPEITPDPYDEDTRVKSLVQQELADRDKKQREDNLLVARDKFFVDFPQYAPQNDPNDYNYGRLREKTSKMVLGNTVEEIYENLVFTHRGLTKPNTPPSIPKDEVGDSGVGDTTPKLKSAEQQPDALTRPLTELEKQAAKLHSGGEKGYREALAKLARKKG